MSKSPNDWAHEMADFYLDGRMAEEEGYPHKPTVVGTISMAMEAERGDTIKEVLALLDEHASALTDLRTKVETLCTRWK